MFVACRRARGSSSRAGRGRPSRPRARWNIATAITVSARSASSANGRVCCGLVPGDDQEAERSALGSLPRRRPRVVDPAPVRRARQEEGARARQSTARRACAASPTDDRRPTGAARRSVGDRGAPRRSPPCSPQLDDRRELVERDVAGTATRSASAIAESGRPSASARRGSSGTLHGCAPSRCRQLRERVGELDRLRAGERTTCRAPASRSEPLRLVERVVPRRPARARAGRTRRSGSTIRSPARRCGNAKRPLSQSQPRSTSGWLRERIRLTFPSRVVALMLQPTGQSPQTDGTFWISHGRASKRYWVEVSAPTGQSSITLPGEAVAVRLVVERRDHRRARRGSRRRAGRPRRRSRRSACSGSRGCSARGRARSCGEIGIGLSNVSFGNVIRVLPGP